VAWGKRLRGSRKNCEGDVPAPTDPAGVHRQACSREKRPLGIPCVRDRVVQAAVRLVIEPIFESVFAPHSYGFRPGRGCKDALREVDRLLKAGYTHILDADLKAYYDSIPHSPLLADVRHYIADGGCWDCWKDSSSRISWRGWPRGLRKRGVHRGRS